MRKKWKKNTIKILISFLIFSEIINNINFSSFYAYQVNPVPNAVVNGGFETKPTKTSVTAVASYQLNQSEIEGWLTTASDSLIELWRSGFKPGTAGAIAVPAHSGNFFAEINATMAATLYQDVVTKPGTIYKWSFWHRGRNGNDVANILLGIPGSEVVAKDINGVSNLVGIKGTGNNLDGWIFHEGYYTTPGTLTETASDFAIRLALKAVSTADNQMAQGNFVDDLNFTPVCDPTIQTIHVGDPKPPGSSLAVLVSTAPSIVDPSGINLVADYAEDSEYTIQDGITPSDLSKPGTYLVKVKITDTNGNFVGYTFSTIIVEATLTVRYLDENGKNILPDVVSTYRDQEAYNVSITDEIYSDPITFSYKETLPGSADLSGTMDSDKTITFIYSYVGFSETVTYEDESGNILQEITKHYNSGDPYEEIPPAVDDEVIINGITYVFKGVKAGSDYLSGTMYSDKDITYILEKKPQVITVNYINKLTGSVLQYPDQILKLNMDPYVVVNPGVFNIGGTIYNVVEVTGDPLTGTADTDKVVNFYLLREQLITVNYYDADNNNNLLKQDMLNVNEGSTYDIPDPGNIMINGILYDVIRFDGDDSSGTADSDKTINFYLSQLFTVTTSYLDQSGNPLKDADVQYLVKGTAYNVTDPGMITIDGVTYKVVKNTGDPLTGTINADKDIDFYLAPPQTVTVNYYDKNGIPIAAPDVQNLFNGDPYDVSNSGTISLGGVTYKVIDKTGDDVSGTMDTDKIVNYYLAPPQTVTVNYLDKNGNPITAPSVINLFNGETYDVSNSGTVTIGGVTYKVIDITGDAVSGTMDTDKIVNYYLLPSQTVTVNYLDHNGNLITAPNVINLFNGDPYDVSNSGTVTLDGVTYEVVNTTGNDVSGIADTDKIVNYYLAAPQTVTVNYLDKNGNPISAPSILGFNQGDPYDVSKSGEVTIDGVTYKVVNATGDPVTGVVDVDKTINYYLVPPQTVTVNYLDEDGNPLTAPSVQNLFNGDPYDVPNPGTMTIGEYTYKVAKTAGDPLTGIADSDKTIDFYLTLQVIVNYLDKYGNPLANSEILDSYDIANTDFLTIDGVTYKVRKIENVAGTGSTDQIFNYILSPPQKVIINYYYLNGDPITDPDILKLFNDDPYDVTDYGFLSDQTEVFNIDDAIACMAGSNLALVTNLGKEVIINGVVYQVVEVTGDELFGVADSDKVINYFLKPPQTLTLNYIDPSGNPLKKSKMVGYNYGDRYVVVLDKEIEIDGKIYYLKYTSGDLLEGIMDSDKDISAVYELKDSLPSTGENIPSIFRFN